MRFSEYIQTGILYESSEPKYQQELLAFLEVLKSQKETKDIRKIKDTIAYVCVKGSESDQKKLYNEILSKFKKYSEKSKVNEATMADAMYPEDKPKSFKQKAKEAGGLVAGGLGMLGLFSAGAGGVVAGGVLATMGLSALGMGMAGAPILGTLIGGGPVMALYAKTGAEWMGGASATERSEIIAGVKKLNDKFKITDKVKSIKKKVESKISDFKKQKTDSKDTKDTKIDKGDKSKGYTGPNEQIQAFSNNIHSMGWDFESIKKYEDYDVVWYSAEKEDGTTNAPKAFDKKIKEIFNEVKKNSTSYAWLTRYWIGGFKEPRYYISVAFGKKPDERKQRELKKV